jgi:tRNA pseudouridine13 synthase
LNYLPKEPIIGIETFSTHKKGIGGTIRNYFEDFKVEELIEHEGTLQGASELQLNHGEIGLFTHFIIWKEGLDTPEAVRLIAQKLDISGEDIGYAGNKDKKAITIQRMSAWKVDPRKLWRLVSSLEKIRVLAAYPARYGVKLGNLWGNQFKIRIRNIKISEDLTAKRVQGITKELMRTGVPNFFGPQRFGDRFLSHLVGKALLMGQYKKAIMMYLSKTSQYESEQIRSVRRKIGETQDFQMGFKQLPARFRYERLLLKYLSRRPNDFKGVLSVFPRRILSLFIHAYQSWLFNNYLSERIKSLESWWNPVPGDLIQVRETTVTEYVTEHNIEVNRNLVKKGRAFVMAPLIGHKSVFPREFPGEIIKKILKAEAIQPRLFNQKDRRIASVGRLRKISIFPNPLNAQLFVLSPTKVVVDLTFCLEKGSYATIVLREFMKEGTIIR